MRWRGRGWIRVKCISVASDLIHFDVAHWNFKFPVTLARKSASAKFPYVVYRYMRVSYGVGIANGDASDASTELYNTRGPGTGLVNRMRRVIMETAACPRRANFTTELKWDCDEDPFRIWDPFSYPTYATRIFAALQLDALSCLTLARTRLRFEPHDVYVTVRGVFWYNG